MATKILFIGNVIKKIEKDNINYVSNIIDAALATYASNGIPIILTNIKKEDANTVFKKLIDLDIEIIIKDNSKTTTIIDDKICEIANPLSSENILEIDANYYYFIPTLNNDVDESIFQILASKNKKIALSLTGFMNYLKNDKISIEKYSSLNEILKYLDHIVLDKDQCFIQEFSHDEDHVAKRYAKLGCKEVLIPYYEALFNYRDNFFYRCKYVLDGEILINRIGDVALASYISQTDILIKEEALFYATALACYYLDNRDLTKLSKEEINFKMIEIGIV